MPIIEGGNVIEGSGGTSGTLKSAGAPGAGTSAVQTITVTLEDSAGGTYRLSFEGARSAALADDAAAADVQTALRALRTIGATGVGVSGSAGGPYTVTFAGTLEKQAVGLISAIEEVGVSVAVENTTPGVNATGRGSAKGTLLVDTATGILYSNTGTPTAPTWTKVGTQT